LIQRSFIALAAFALCACQHGSPPLPSALPDVTNLGLAVKAAYGSGALRVVTVPEEDQGADLNGDGDALDDVVHVIDLERGTVTNTGLVLGSSFPRGEIQPSPVLAVGSHVVFAASESESGALDRNGDGDADDLVLALYERDSAGVLDLSVAASRVLASERLLAVNVPEFAQGQQDLDGDGTVDVRTTVPFVHDFVTGETWNTGLRGAEIQGVDERFVALSVEERVAGADLDGDGDRFDLVFELYDTVTRTVQHAGLAYAVSFGFPSTPRPHRGWWYVLVRESAQGQSDLNGDGDADDDVVELYDSLTGTVRSLGDGDPVLPIPELEPFVVRVPSASSPARSTIQLYDPLTQTYADTGFAAFTVFGLEHGLALQVSESEQQEDLDGDGSSASLVPVIYDLDTGLAHSLGVDASLMERTRHGLLLATFEGRGQRDWNGDGDADDFVLQAWDERSGSLSNARLAVQDMEPFGPERALVLVAESEAAADLNGDGDRDDLVLQVYDFRARRATNAGLAGFFLYEADFDPALVPVLESDQGADLDGDGDLEDIVLHRVTGS